VDDEEDPKLLSFGHGFDDGFAVGADGRDRAFFGLDVLRGLIEGIEEHGQDPRWRHSRSLGPVLLGSSMWIDDDELIDKLGSLTACIVVTKQGRDQRKLEKLERLRELNERTAAVPIRAFPGLGGLAPKLDGEPEVVGPYSQFGDAMLPTIRMLGFRSKERRHVPIVHAKLALLGQMWWHDEGALGHVEDVIGFTPQQLWISSANFTAASRRSLEFGYLTEQHELLEGAERFLVRLMGSSEDLDPDADVTDPELAHVDFDDEAMAEALWDDANED
jgi:hypothetical protein